MESRTANPLKGGNGMHTQLIRLHGADTKAELSVLHKAEDFIALQKAAMLLGQGELVAFPTETVYGLGANALSEEAVAKIFLAKERPADNPLIVHIAKLEELRLVARSWPQLAETLITHFWPGPLTLVLPRKPELASNVSAGLDTVAVRMPKHPIALQLLRITGLPIAAPSANRSGRPSPTTAEHVLQDMNEAIAAVIDGGSTSEGVESTVLDLSGERPAILRPGSVTRDMLLPYIPDLATEPHSEDLKKSPGTRYAHYAPRAAVHVYRGADADIRERILRDVVAYRTANRRVAILAPGPFYDPAEADIVVDLSCPMDGEDMGAHPYHYVGQNLFAMFRHCDDMHIRTIYVHGMRPTGLGEAIMNRLERAAREIIDVGGTA